MRKVVKNACSKFLEPMIKENGFISKQHVDTLLDTSPSNLSKAYINNRMANYR